MSDDTLNPGERLLEGNANAENLQASTEERLLTGTQPAQIPSTQPVHTQPVQAQPAQPHDLRAEAAELLGAQTDHLVLYEERAKVDVVRESAGAVTIRKVVTEREEMVPVTLRSECLEIVVQPGAGCVRMGGEQLQEGQTYQIELSTERASVQKEVVPISEVSFEKRTVSQDTQQTVTLRREVLDVEDPQHLVINAAEFVQDKPGEQR